MTPPTTHGLLVIDKPSGITSRAAVNQVQRWFPRGTRLGHAGTLDPLATGVLVLCVGRATRLIEYVQDMDKEYHTDLTLGAFSTTDDADGEIATVTGAQPPSRERLEETLPRFTGTILQTPPSFSAAKVAGRRAHALARQGQPVALAPRPVRVYSLTLLHYEYPTLTLQVCCGKGTYIRSLARDLGRELGCGAYVRTLRRTRIGPFSEAAALPLGHGTPPPDLSLLPLEHALSNLPRIDVGPHLLKRLTQGQGIPLPGEARPEAGLERTGQVAVFSEGQLMAVGEVSRDKKNLLPVKVLCLP